MHEFFGFTNYICVIGKEEYQVNVVVQSQQSVEDFNLVSADATDETKLSRQNLSLDFVTDNCDFVCYCGTALSHYKYGLNIPLSS